MEKLNIIICDLDGTLSIFSKIDKSNPTYRNPYNASTCDNDKLNEPIALILSKFDNVILLSGREDKYKEPTLRFLQKHNIKYLDLIMRKSGDNRKDSIIKQEIYEQQIKPHYNTLFILDDRNQVVNMWRQLGLTCLQVAEGDF